MLPFFFNSIYVWLSLAGGTEYNGNRSEWNDLEPEKTVTPPRDMDDPYREYNPDYDNYIGLLFAGELEFTWIVDITSDVMDPKYFSVGNLISHDKVLTACRLFWLMEKHSTKLYQLKVRYCMQNTNETAQRPVDSLFRVLSSTDMLAGSRNVIKVWHHPQCIHTSHEHDLSLMQLDKRINPYNPLICFAPIPIDKYTAHILDQDLSTMNNYKLVCHVASFGRGYMNAAHPITEGYKTKVRAYYAKWETCLDAWDHICNKTDELACKTKSAKPAEIMCFNSRAKVGSVCDHDRGAPLVCQGEIMGIVERGALFSHCSNVLSFPFIVTKIRDFGWIFKAELYRDNQIYGQLSYDYETIMPANMSPAPEPAIPLGGGTQIRIDEIVILGLLGPFFFISLLFW